MSDSSSGATSPRPIPGPVPITPAPVDWKTAVMDLVAARCELIRIEFEELRRQSARRAVILVCAGIAGVSAWLLLLAGAVPLLSAALNITWPVMALLLAALHGVVVAICLAQARRPSGPAFPATTAEFKKDREWIETISNKKS